ncbi:MAG: PKD domain-containing protein [Muribaculaceae bacterium]|nr:PKD domain-containing protein [Muribaculaceae bacterium]
MKKITLLMLSVAVAALSAWGQGVTASFSADEASMPYYQMGWDDADEFATWTYQSTSSSTWRIGNPSQSFQSVDASSSASMILDYSSGQNEVATSPAIEIRPNSTLEFYCYASGIYLVYGAWKLYAVVDGVSTLLIDQFMWAQDAGYDGPSWERFTVDLANYAGKQVQFSFVYEGSYGEDEAIDGFKILQANDGDDAVIDINVGESVHFKDMSTGNVTSWDWTFEGGEPASSTEQNPVVTYNSAGSYAVTLTVSDGTATETKTRDAYVVVHAEAPVAHVGMPDGAYLSPWVMMFVPTDVPLTFKDASTGFPTSWLWTFDGTDIATSTLQNPIVTYLQEGTYGLKLEVANDVGSSVDEYVNTAIQAGGEQEVWNIAPEENGDLMMMEMGWYGNYAGTNWLGMGEFAEHFDAPLTDAQISKVNVYFGKTTAGSTDADIEMKIMTVGDDGMPAEVLGSTSVKAGDLAYDPTTINATEFVFDEPIDIPAGTEFFAVIGPFPNDNADDIAILLCRRAVGEKCTGYHFVYDEDANYNYLETGSWYQNVDDPLSLAVAPMLRFVPVPQTGIAQPEADKQAIGCTYYNLTGVASSEPFDGVNIVVTRYSDGTTTATKVIR